MAASFDYTERCHIVLVRSLWSTRSLAVSTLVNSHFLARLYEVQGELL